MYIVHVSIWLSNTTQSGDSRLYVQPMKQSVIEHATVLNCYHCAKRVTNASTSLSLSARLYWSARGGGLWGSCGCPSSRCSIQATTWSSRVSMYSEKVIQIVLGFKYENLKILKGQGCKVFPVSSCQ